MAELKVASPNNPGAVGGKMTVRDLIKELLNMPLDAAVFYLGGNIEEDRAAGLAPTRVPVTEVNGVIWGATKDTDEEFGYVRLD